MIVDDFRLSFHTRLSGFTPFRASLFQAADGAVVAVNLQVESPAPSSIYHGSPCSIQFKARYSPKSGQLH